MPITPDCFNLPPIYEIDSYILRDFDTELFIHDNSNVAYFCKTPRFFFWATIKRDHTNLNYGIKINPNRGKINLKKYKVGDGYVKGYILSRIKKSFSDLQPDFPKAIRRSNQQNNRKNG